MRRVLLLPLFGWLLPNTATTTGGTEVAIKIPNYQLEESSTSELEEVRQEIRMLRKIFHPNVVLLIGASTDPGSIRIVFELMKASVKALIGEPVHAYHKKWNDR